jgi:hypothetical protein
MTRTPIQRSAGQGLTPYSLHRSGPAQVEIDDLTKLPESTVSRFTQCYLKYDTSCLQNLDGVWRIFSIHIVIAQVDEAYNCIYPSSHHNGFVRSL